MLLLALTSPRRAFDASLRSPVLWTALTTFALLATPSLRAADLVLSEFNGTGFDYTFDDFTQTIGPTSVRVRDAINGWGGAGVTSAPNFSGWEDSWLVIDFTPLAGNRVNTFTIELIEQSTGGETTKSGKWDFNVAGLTPGVPVSLTSATTLSQPTSGLGDYGNLNLSQVNQWQVLGQFGSSDLFDIEFDRIVVSNDAPPPPAYPGAESDAPWRTEAASRIEANRKADLSVTVRDLSGAVVPGAAVHVAMQQHEFGFGTAVQAYRLRDSNPQHNTYKAKTAELFNVATLENNLKWQPWEGEWGGSFTQQGALNALDWLAQNGIDSRGHVMVWPGTDNLPADIRQMLSDNNLTPAEQQTVRTRIAQHIAEIGAATAGKVVAWDVINETRTNNDLMRELSEGDQATVTWMQQAAAATAPGTGLYINDFGILNTWGRGANRNQYYDTVEALQDGGAPVTGVGFQGHFTEGDIVGPEELWEVFDRFAELGLDMQITEFDFNTTNEELQAQYLSDFMMAVFAHEGVDDFIQWGFFEDAHWRPDAAMFRSDWSIKPSGEAYLDLVFNDWWTDVETSADAAGDATVRGFKGDYQVTASAGGESETVSAVLSDDGESLSIVLNLLVGDYNQDGAVDAADYTVWRDSVGASTANLAADGDNDGVVDEADRLVWASRYGATATTSPLAGVPEPGAWSIAAVCCLICIGRRCQW
ncbi:Endo-1,4-beta-xylanase A precursor [Botrimarina colliarenosi]|uniref:Beta-xylanase n=1 Tax=Botrimarina colliarenosi TaxID=2528001 RepID=A0A5C6A0P0_9BACT|nr:endo-1,4-beta-xylanase [Botrimarina colliarenosi]TWT92887.1 Endo-1,4-beta-xylanase A precursor [Botrimarina colliarenosi]